LLAGHSYFEETASTSEADILPQFARFISASAHTQPFLLLSSTPPHFICSVAQNALQRVSSVRSLGNVNVLLIEDMINVTHSLLGNASALLIEDMINVQLLPMLHGKNLIYACLPVVIYLL
jgi:hypothetical protein